MVAANSTSSQPMKRPSSVAFLRDLLSAGARTAGDVAAISSAAGYAWRTMQDAGVKLSVRRRKSGMLGGWIWTLPAESTEGTSTIRAFGASDPTLSPSDSWGCLAAYGFEAPLDGLLYSRPHLD